ncbi:MAG: cyclopropane fatty acyl phospholipid synthase [Dissulfurispiraceae bacterium]
MGISRLRSQIQEILSSAGITINGTHPWDIQIINEEFYQRVMTQGSLGLGESYMDGWWDCENLDDFFFRLMPSQPEDKIKKNWKIYLHVKRARLFNVGCKDKAFQIAEKHYDLGNELYKKMLDKRMVYSCAYWKNLSNLNDAQEAKLDLTCRKLGLRPGDKILDIGCGWGSFARYAAEKYKVLVVGITVSNDQLKLAKDVCKGLPVEIRLQDYRELKETFDHIVSIGMFEHVGYKNYRTYMEAVSNCLRDNGLFLLHTIRDCVSKVTGDPWFDKYIFPNSLIPSMQQISKSAEKLFVVEDWYNFGFYYHATLSSWFENFQSNWSILKAIYDDRFYRMWKYSLLCSAGTFRSRCL